MEQNIQIFENPNFGQIRTAGTSENPLFCLTDVCRALGLTAKHVMERLDKGVVSTDTLPTRGGNQTFNFVNEDGLYDVILDSRKPEAKAFRKWVTSEVLPSIRKHGAYMTNELIEKTLADPDYLIQLATELKKERQARQLAENDAQLKQKQLDKQQPKVEFYDTVTISKDTVDMNEAAKLLRIPNVGRNALFALLRDKQVLDSKNRPYQKYVKQGYFKLVETQYYRNGEVKVGLKPVVYQKGLDFIRKLFRDFFREGNKVQQLELDLEY